jgi:hypothetical protein
MKPALYRGAMKLLVCLAAFLGSQALASADPTPESVAAQITKDRRYLDHRSSHKPQGTVSLWHGPSPMQEAMAAAYAYLTAAQEHLNNGYLGHAALAANRAHEQRLRVQRLRTRARQPSFLYRMTHPTKRWPSTRVRAHR